MENNFREIKDAYRKLISAYITVLNDSTKAKSSLLGERYITGLFIESHIKSKLIELAKSLRYYDEKLKAKRNYRNNSDWIIKRIVDCDELAQTLTSWQTMRNLVIALAPLVTGLVLARLGIETIYQVVNLDYLQSTFLILAFYIGLVFLYSGFLFAVKRGVLTKFEIYSLEKTMFHLLDRKSKPEPPFDLIGTTIGMSLSIIAAFYFLNVLFPEYVNLRRLGIFLTIYIIIFYSLQLIMFNNRLKEQE